MAHEQKPGNSSLSRAMQGVLFIGLSAYLAHLIQADKLSLYIVPRLEPAVRAAGLALFLLGAWQALQSLRDTIPRYACACEEGRKPGLRRKLAALWLALPLLLGALLPDTVLGASVADKKGLVWNPGDYAAKSAELYAGGGGGKGGGGKDGGGSPQSFSPEVSAARLREYELLADELHGQDWIRIGDVGYMERLAAMDLNRERFVGKTLQLSGFVYPAEDRAGAFFLSRLVMQCCSADSLPYGLLIEGAEATAFKRDDWVRVTGTLREVPYQNQMILALTAVSVESMEKPSSPYVYPYTGAYADLP
ncbi:TIGR03943 family protein [Gorillibacterium sp. CAU 1737]|uniref:TIGR03943 family putative permease subunit n=1 Tax=Gorillibacterium sp. CAU 1737 TaxID=3140362 RepID=UPI0032602223